MSEIVSNLVNALHAVRGDYNERLKTVPQYEAFLLVETSTQTVFEALQGLVNAPKPSMAAEVIASLETAKSKFKEHLTSVAEYRALLAIDKLISDVASDTGVQAASAEPSPAQTAPSTAEPEAAPHVIAASPSEPAASSASVHPDTQSAASEIVSTHEAVATGPEPGLVASAPASSAHTGQAEIASLHPIAETEAEPEPEPGLTLYSPTPVEAPPEANVASAATEQTDTTAPEPQPATAATEQTVTEAHAAEIASSQPPTTEDRPSGEATLNREPEVSGAPPSDTAPTEPFAQDAERAA